MSKATDYVSEARAELKKVQWPTRQDTIRHTITVILISIGVAAFLGVFDFIFNLALEALIA